MELKENEVAKIVAVMDKEDVTVRATGNTDDLIMLICSIVDSLMDSANDEEERVAIGVEIQNKVNAAVLLNTLGMTKDLGVDENER